MSDQYLGPCGMGLPSRDRPLDIGAAAAAVGARCRAGSHLIEVAVISNDRALALSRMRRAGGILVDLRERLVRALVPAKNIDLLKGPGCEAVVVEEASAPLVLDLHATFPVPWSPLFIDVLLGKIADAGLNVVNLLAQPQLSLQKVDLQARHSDAAVLHATRLELLGDALFDRSILRYVDVRANPPQEQFARPALGSASGRIRVTCDEPGPNQLRPVLLELEPLLRAHATVLSGSEDETTGTASIAVSLEGQVSEDIWALAQSRVSSLERRYPGVAIELRFGALVEVLY